MVESNAVFIAALKPREFNFELVSISREFFLENETSAHARRRNLGILCSFPAILSKPLIEESFEKCFTQQWDSIQHFLWHFRLSTRSLFVNQHAHTPIGHSSQARRNKLWSFHLKKFICNYFLRLIVLRPSLFYLEASAQLCWFQLWRKIFGSCS